MKKIKLLLIGVITAVFLILPANVIAEEKAKINVYLFRGEGCPHCEEAMEFFNKLEKDEEYSKYFKLKKYEVWYDQDNNKLMSKVAKELDEEANGVPYIVIGKKSFSGYASSYDDKIKSAIKDSYEDEAYVDVVKKFVKEDVKKDSSSSPVIPIIIVSVVAIIVIAGLVIITKKM